MKFMRHAIHHIATGLLVAISATACGQAPTKQASTAQPATSQVAAARPAAAATALPVAEAPAPLATPEGQRDYVVGSGDVLRISVYQNADLTLDARVSESGVISYPLLGQVKVGGRSIAQVEKTIADGLRNGNFLRQPQVGVLLVQVRGNQASVLGMAGRPGRYPIEVNGMRLSELLALAGGVAIGGSEIVTLSGMRDGQSFRQKVDIGQLFGGPQSDDPIVLNGDTLYVERAPTIFIYGEVQRPGPVSMLPDMTLMQALASGGGLTQRGTARGMQLHRRDAAGKLQVYNPKMDDMVRSGDVIYVKESLF